MTLEQSDTRVGNADKNAFSESAVTNFHKELNNNKSIPEGQSIVSGKAALSQATLDNLLNGAESIYPNTNGKEFLRKQNLDINNKHPENESGLYKNSASDDAVSNKLSKSPLPQEALNEIAKSRLPQEARGANPPAEALVPDAGADRLEKNKSSEQLLQKNQASEQFLQKNESKERLLREGVDGAEALQKRIEKELSVPRRNDAVVPNQEAAAYRKQSAPAQPGPAPEVTFA